MNASFGQRIATLRKTGRIYGDWRFSKRALRLKSASLRFVTERNISERCAFSAQVARGSRAFVRPLSYKYRDPSMPPRPPFTAGRTSWRASMLRPMEKGTVCSSLVLAFRPFFRYFSPGRCYNEFFVSSLRLWDSVLRFPKRNTLWKRPGVSTTFANISKIISDKSRRRAINYESRDE